MDSTAEVKTAEPLFIDYKTWREQNEDRAKEILESLDLDEVCECECVGLNRSGDPFDDCNECDGSGSVGGDGKREVENQMRGEYAKQLERDYILAVRSINQPVEELIHG